MTPDEVAAELNRRGCRLFHAIGLPDFRTYVDLGALVSREQLLDKGIGTPFESDDSDRRRGILNRCFGNLADFGARFWKHEEAPPNVYGPILLVFKADVFTITQDAAVTVKNAIADDYDLAGDRMVAPAVLRELFNDDDGPQVVPWRFFSEFSTSTHTIPFEYLESIVVEPLTFVGESLMDAVVNLVGGRWDIVPRDTKPLDHKVDLLDALAFWSAERGGTAPGPMDEPPMGVDGWWKTVKPWGVGVRWFQYITSTLKDLAPDEVADPAPEPPRCLVCDGYARARCSGCGRWLCFDDYFGMDADGKFDAKVQGRCWECCYDPT